MASHCSFMLFVKSDSITMNNKKRDYRRTTSSSTTPHEAHTALLPSFGCLIGQQASGSHANYKTQKVSHMRSINVHEQMLINQSWMHSRNPLYTDCNDATRHLSIHALCLSAPNVHKIKQTKKFKGSFDYTLKSTRVTCITMINISTSGFTDGCDPVPKQARRSEIKRWRKKSCSSRCRYRSRQGSARSPPRGQVQQW